MCEYTVYYIYIVRLYVILILIVIHFDLFLKWNLMFYKYNKYHQYFSIL